MIVKANKRFIPICLRLSHIKTLKMLCAQAHYFGNVQYCEVTRNIQTVDLKHEQHCISVILDVKLENNT